MEPNKTEFILVATIIARPGVFSVRMAPYTLVGSTILLHDYWDQKARIHRQESLSFRTSSPHSFKSLQLETEAGREKNKS